MPKQPPISKTVQDDMVTYFSQTNPETGKPFTLEEVAAKVNLPVSTVGKYRQRWEEKQRAEEAAASTTTRPDPVAVFERELRNTPGLRETQVDWAIKQMRANPEMYLKNPQDLWALLSNGVQMSRYHGELVMKAVLSAAAEAAQAQSPPFFAQGIPPGAAPPYWAPLGSGPAMNPYGNYYPPAHTVTPPLWGAPAAAPSLYGPPPWWWAQPPPQQERGLTKEDVRELIEQAVARAAAPAPSVEYEESQDPVIDPETRQPMVGPDGGVLMRFTRRPAGLAGTVPRRDPIDDLLRARDLLMPKNDAGLAEIKTSLANLESRFNAGPRDDPETRKMLGEIKEKLAREEARREEAEKHAQKMELKEAELRRAEVDLATARNSGNLPPDAQILKSGVETVDKHLGGVLTNMDKRQDRLEKLVHGVLLPPAPGPSLPMSTADLEHLERRQQEIDAAEATAARAAAPAAAAEAPPAPAEPRIETPKTDQAPAE